MRKLLFFTAALCLVYVVSAVCSAEMTELDTVVYINGSEREVSAYTDENGSVYVPLRDVFETAGCEVGYDAEAKTAQVIYEGKILEFSQLDSENTATINGSMYLSLDVISESLGIEEKDGAVYINIVSESPEVQEEEPVSDNGLDFALKLNSLMDKDENYVLNPVSLKYALAMAANGADDETKAEILKALNISDLNGFNEGAKAYMESAAQKYKDSSEYVWESGEFEAVSAPVGTGLSIANSIWLNEDRIEGGDFSESFKAVIEDNYNAEAQTVTNDTAIDKINSWCSENTNEKISQIISRADFIAALVNAVYFNGNWANDFNEALTAPDTFTNSDGSESEIDFMNQTDYFKYYGDEDVQIICLPYKSSTVSMYVALTEDEDINVLKYADKAETEKVNVKLPKFKTETSLNAVELLKALGVTAAFDDSEDGFHFKNMFNDVVNETDSIYISDVFHKTYISVDEEGTEAAAVTALILMETSAAPDLEEEIYDFNADKPFTYFIRDDSNGEILFIGRYAVGE
ncbi:MAG: hypothetical protein LUC97_10985 [Clostridiales bacterium]|nr:hypothetical protein [Clostridiales bacterium]